jgi:hypothetical protein
MSLSPGSTVIDQEKLRQLMAGGPNVPMIAPPLGGAPASPQLPALNFKQRQALPTVSEGTPAGSSAFYGNKIARIEDQEANPYGSADNHPGTLGKIGHVLGTIGNDIGEVADPAAMARIPGTNANRLAQEQNLQKQINIQQPEADRLAEGKVKHGEFEETLGNKEATAQDKDTAALAKQGLTRDKDGNIVADEQSPIYQNNQAKAKQLEETHTNLMAYRQAQTDLASARADVEKSKNDPNSLAYKTALQRLQQAEEGHRIAAGRLQLQQDEYTANYLGRDNKGNALPGATKDDQGNPIGPRVANAGATSADRLKRSDLARNVETNAIGFKQLIKDNPDLFGQIAGHFTTVEQMIGSNNPAIARVGVAVHNMALASNGAHGVRSQEAVEETQNEILNHFRNGPEATMAAVDELVGSVQTFREDAQHGKRPNNEPIKGEGGAPTGGVPKVGDVVDGFKFKGGDPSNPENWTK